jgi:hypothetical protein
LAFFHFDHQWHYYLLWNAVAFPIAFLFNSFIEWGAHRFVMHKPYIKYGYLHTTSHHRVFGHDHTYHAQTLQMLEHGIGFSWREYVIFPVSCTFLYLPLQFLLHRPIYFGCLASVFMGLILFDILHRRFHNPRNTWFQRTRYFLFLKEHHRLHHKDMSKNFNVNFFPIADWVMRTLKR